MTRTQDRVVEGFVAQEDGEDGGVILLVPGLKEIRELGRLHDAFDAEGGDRL